MSASPPETQADFSLEQGDDGRWIYRNASGAEHAGVNVVRAFPIGAPDQGVAIVDGDAHELQWIERLDALPPALRQNVDTALAQREFMPTILRLKSVSTFATPSTWDIDTDRGGTRPVLKGEQDIRRLTATVLIVSDTHGVQYLIRDPLEMDAHSRRLLDRFM